MAQCPVGSLMGSSASGTLAIADRDEDIRLLWRLASPALQSSDPHHRPRHGLESVDRGPFRRGRLDGAWEEKELERR